MTYISHSLRRFSLALFCVLGIPSISAAEFKANISSTEARIASPIVLELVLEGISAENDPKISILEKDFAITRSWKSKNISLGGGGVATTTSWSFEIVPQRQGQLVIPPITIETTAGKTLATEAINLMVSGQPFNAEELELQIRLSQDKVYLGQPVLLYAELQSTDDLFNLYLDGVKSPHADVLLWEQPTIRNTVIDNTAVKLLEAIYVIIPTASATINLTPLVLSGEHAPPQRNNFWFWNREPRATKPFQTQKTPPAIEVVNPRQRPWLPASKLTIESSFDSTSPQQGFAITRTIKIKAEALLAQQLPSLENQQQARGISIKKREFQLEQKLEGTKIISIRTERYLIVPQISGKITLPPMSIKWWNIETDQATSTDVPAAILEPSIEGLQTPSTEFKFIKNSQKTNNIPPQSVL